MNSNKGNFKTLDNKNSGWKSEYDNGSEYSLENTERNGTLYHSSIAQRIKRLFNEQRFTDVKIILNCGSKPKPYVLAHRAILCIGSPKFAKILEAKDGVPPNVVEICDIPFKAFSSVVEYLYTDEVYFGNDDQVVEILVAARALEVPSLVSRCESYIELAEITHENVCMKLQLAESSNLLALRARCVQYIQENTAAVFRSRSFKMCEADTLEMICRLPRLNLKSEKDLFQSVMAWIQHLPERQSQRSKILSPLLRHIRFLTLSTTEFTELLSSHPNIVSATDALNIVLYLNKQSANLPSWCSRLSHRCNKALDSPPPNSILPHQKQVSIPLKPTPNGHSPQLTCRIQLRCVEGQHIVRSLRLAFAGPVGPQSAINHMVITVLTEPSNFTFKEKIRIANSEELEVRLTRLLRIRRGDTLTIWAEASQVSNYQFLMFDENSYIPQHPFECSFTSTPKGNRLFFISGIVYEDAPPIRKPYQNQKRR